MEIPDSFLRKPFYYSVSARDIEFLTLIVSEMDYREIADRMFIDVRSVHSYQQKLCKRLGFKNRHGLMLFAIKNL